MPSDPSLRDTLCSCFKPAGVYGKHGWHWRQHPAYPGHPQMDGVVERCPTYGAALQRSRHERMPWKD